MKQSNHGSITELLVVFSAGTDDDRLEQLWIREDGKLVFLKLSNGHVKEIDFARSVRWYSKVMGTRRFTELDYGDGFDFWLSSVADRLSRVEEPSLSKTPALELAEVA